MKCIDTCVDNSETRMRGSKMSELKSWYVRQNDGKPYGPYLWTEIVGFTQEGRITFTSSVKCPFQTDNKWVNARYINGLKPYFVSPPIQQASQGVDFFSPPVSSEIEVDDLSTVYQPSSLQPARRKPKRDSTLRRFIEIGVGGVLALILYLTVLRDHVIPKLQEKTKEFINAPAPVEIREATHR